MDMMNWMFGLIKDKSSFLFSASRVNCVWTSMMFFWLVINLQVFVIRNDESRTMGVG